jgi:flavin reductase (DIM6/NTAB) family NADH-FMN oxidoreductase RutF
MQLLKKLLNNFNGLHYHQEYLCLSKEDFEHPLHSYLVNKTTVIKDITGLHLFVGYSPLIIALSSLTVPGADSSTIEIAFSDRPLQQNEELGRKEAIAHLSLIKIHESKQGNDLIFFYEGVRGSHHFVSNFHQWVIELNNQLYNKKEGNVFLKNNLYKQVQIAYSIPRKICLVTVGENDRFNLFPTDLHGRIGHTYVISLRKDGKACKQVESVKRIVLSDINTSAYKNVYALGKNHMQPLKEKSLFEWNAACSKNFNLPLPKDVLCYKELQLEQSFLHGIHKLLQFRIVSEEKISQELATLSHIHNCYATWRYKHRISSNLLLR